MIDRHIQTSLTAALTHAEATADRFGWDQPPVLVGLFHLPGVADTHEIQVDPTLIGHNAWHLDTATDGQSLAPTVALHRLTTNLAAAPMRNWLRGWMHRDGRHLIGFGLLFEAWLGPVHPGYRHGDLAKAPEFARIEARVVAALDADQRLYQIIRQRGADQSAVSTWADPPPHIRATRVAAGLTRLMGLARTL